MEGTSGVTGVIGMEEGVRKTSAIGEPTGEVGEEKSSRGIEGTGGTGGTFE